MSQRQNLARIKAVYKALGSLQNKVVFVGGATVALYADRPAAEVRPTDDIDLVIERWTRVAYAQVEETLRQRGFEHDTESGIICRFRIDGVVVDLMPVAQEILGFANRWYAAGIQKAVTSEIDEECRIKLFSAPYFLAAKLEAFNNRGRNDGRTSADFEDIVYLLNYRNAIWKEMESAESEVLSYLRDEFRKLLQNPYLEEWIAAHLEFSEQANLIPIIANMNDIVNTQR